ncbi:MAG: 23S rRNA (guanosine(2251)-2'-O)-methyltransferase RlmB [Acidobacteriota bacterium]|nr:23S rRNA (guanosine(2251)-2'-O)-methyltransferase RlmB [Acidobacteriota bacterium]
MAQKHGHREAFETLYGIHTVKEALRSRPIDYVVAAEGGHGPRVEEILQLCREKGIPLRFAPRPALDRMAEHGHHQNVIAVCAAKNYDDLEAFTAPEGSILLIALDEVEDPANLGAVLRTAVAAGAHGAIIPERRAAGLSAATARSASGALEHLKVARVTNLTRALLGLKKKDVWVYGFEAGAPKSYLDLDYSGPCALVLGGEGHGLRRLVREACDELASIPLHGPVESLNVSAAAAVVLYEAARQRRGVNDSNRME